MKRRHVQPLIDAVAGIEAPAMSFLGAQFAFKSDIPELSERVQAFAAEARSLMLTLTQYRAGLPPEGK